MINVIIKALENNDITGNFESEICNVKFSGMVNQNTQALYWVLMKEEDLDIWYINRLYLNVEDLTADFAGQTEFESDKYVNALTVFNSYK